MFLDNSKTFDIAGHYVLTFKVEKNGTSGNLSHPKAEADSKQPTFVLERWNCICSLTFIHRLEKNQLLEKTINYSTEDLKSNPEHFVVDTSPFSSPFFPIYQRYQFITK